VGSGSHSDGVANLWIGNFSLANVSSGFQNVAVGDGALWNTTSGSQNVGTGSTALSGNTTGSNNAGFGESSLFSNTTGNENTALGNLADVTTGALNNATAIGYNAKVNASNKVRIGNTSVTVIEGNVAFTSTSDARLKEGIRPLTSGLNLINDLNPVSYHRINNPGPDIEMGLVAQEVEATLEKYGMSNSGMVQQATEDSYKSLRYNDLLAPIIKAIQELGSQHDQEMSLLQEQVESQQAELLAIVKAQQVQINQLQKLVELLAAQ
jgi:hypothetical protein